MNNFEQLLGALDLQLFEKIESQSSDNDKKSLLACQLAAREIADGYNYLEIGSYLGGSIQPHLLDDRCARIVSIDKRPERQPDERGSEYKYLNNSTARMMEKLKDVALEKLGKITTIDGDTRELKPEQVTEKMQLCFIDGEHTDAAAFSDFQFCIKTLDANGAILFHDAATTYNGLLNAIKYLKDNEIQYRAYNLPDIVFAIEIGDFPLHKHPAVQEMLLDNHIGYLNSLAANDYTRVFFNKTLFKYYRSIRTAFKKKHNTFE
jgi:predicted O-methyltransferase YrrM